MTLWTVLTVAVAPTVTHKVAVTDPEERAREYHAALTAWGRTCARLGARLVVVETTGTERSAFWPAGVAGELVGVHADAAVSARGKGAVEALALDAALERGVGPGAGTDDTVYKCTGRLWVADADRMLAPLAANTARVRRTLDRTWVDGRFLGATAGVWRRSLSGMSDEVDDRAGRYVEHVLAERVARAAAVDGTTVERFGRRPTFVGRSGSMGIDYRSPRERLKTAVLGPVEALLAGPLARKLL